MATHEIWLCYWVGTRLLELPLGPGTRFEYVKAVNHTGVFTLELPYRLQNPKRELQLDNLIQFWRSPAGGIEPKRLDFLGWLRYWRYERKDDGSIATILKGHDQNGLIDRRIIAYDSDDAMSSTSIDPDGSMKDIFYQNFTGAATDPLRDLSLIQGLSSSYAASISQDIYLVGASLTTVEMRFAWARVRDVYQKLQEMSFTDDTTSDKSKTLYYGIRVNGIDNSKYQRPILRFETNLGHWNQDRTWSSSRPSSILFNNENGNLINEFYEEDHRYEQNVIYAGGVGVGAARDVRQAVDAPRTKISGWARSEGWVDARSQETSAAVTDAAYARLAEMRPRTIAGGDLIDTDYARYGRNWFHGDKVTIEVFGTKYNGVVMTTRYLLEDGQENITSRVVHEST